MNQTSTVFVVLSPSAISLRTCLLGHGATKEEAMTDAFGPKPWPRSAKAAICKEVTEDEFFDLRAGVNS
jgi:hypothetical protein